MTKTLKGKGKVTGQEKGNEKKNQEQEKRKINIYWNSKRGNLEERKRNSETEKGKITGKEEWGKEMERIRKENKESDRKTNDKT